MVGFYAPFYNHDDDVSTLMHNFNSYTQRLFSFEMKISVTTQNLKEYFFKPFPIPAGQISVIWWLLIMPLIVIPKCSA